MPIVTPSPSSFDRSGGAEGIVAAPAAPAIRLSGIHKRFRKHASRGDYTTLKSSFLSRLFGGVRSKPVFLEALRGIDLEVPRGATLGIIGRNGSGKSTLLKIVAGIIRPDEGEVLVDGRISPLIELGAGFHPEFSGRENVFLNGLVLGLTRGEIEERFDSIVAFAELPDFIDAPVRTYSSGMFMRLAFSVAVHADPDVLLIDEILTVGDEAFVAKCEERLAEFQSSGKTIVIVSHNLEAIERWCHEAVWIDGGVVAARGYPAEVVRRYHTRLDTGPSAPPKKRPLLRDSRDPGRLRAALRVLEPPSRTAEPHQIAFRCLLEIANEGDTVWRSFPPTRRGMVMVGGHAWEGDRRVREIERALLPRDVYPGERAVVELKFVLPRSGRFRIDLDLVSEEICWFSDAGSPVRPVEVDA